MRTAQHLPAEPLVALVRARGGLEGCGVHKSSWQERAFYVAARRGSITVDAADQWSIQVLGMHPALIWGQAWWA